MSNQTITIDINALYEIDNLTTDEKNKLMKEPDKFRIDVSFFLEDCVEFFSSMLRREIIQQTIEKANFKGASYNEKEYDNAFEIALSKCMDYLQKVAVIAREKGIQLSNIPIIDDVGNISASPSEIELAIYDIIDQYKQLRLKQI